MVGARSSFFQSTSINLDFRAPSISAPSTFLAFFSFSTLHRRRAMSFFSFFFFFFSSFFLSFVSSRARVHDRLSRPLGTAHNYSSGTLPNSRSLITVFERHARSVNGCRRDRRFKLLYWIVDGVSAAVTPSTTLLPLCLPYGVCILAKGDLGQSCFHSGRRRVREIDWIINSENYSVYFCHAKIR